MIWCWADVSYVQNAALTSAWLQRKSKNKPRTVMTKRRPPRESRSSAVSSSLECLLRCVSRLHHLCFLCHTVFAAYWDLCFYSTGVWSSGLWSHGHGGAGSVLRRPGSQIRSPETHLLQGTIHMLNRGHRCHLQHCRQRGDQRLTIPFYSVDHRPGLIPPS